MIESPQARLALLAVTALGCGGSVGSAGDASSSDAGRSDAPGVEAGLDGGIDGSGDGGFTCSPYLRQPSGSPAPCVNGCSVSFSGRPLVYEICTIECAKDGSCPPDFTCRDIPIGADTLRLCLPVCNEVLACPAPMVCPSGVGLRVCD